jgi:hypothetical protein
MDTVTLIARREFRAAELMHAYPPRVRHANKKLVFEIACPLGTSAQGTLGFSRWRAGGLAAAVPDHPTAIELRAEAFGYEPEPTGDVAFHVNFADPRLFFAYAGPLLAQDELQVAEHPALASLLEALLALGEPALTVEDGTPTPVVVTGVERRCAIDTRLVYGNAFARAPEELVRRATRRLDPPTTSNILAIAALGGGIGAYTAGQIEYTLRTAAAGFEAARREASRLAPGASVTVHSGFWGCGAFGGNRVLMALLQLTAARLARIDRLVFHAMDSAGGAAYGQARSLLDRLAPAGAAVPGVIATIAALGLEWGVSDGT